MTASACITAFGGANSPQVVPGEFVVRVSGGGIELDEPAAGKGLGAVRAGSGSALEKVATRHKLAGAERLTKSAKKGQKSAAGSADVLRLVFPADADAASVMQELKQLPGVVAVEPNYAGSLCYVPSDPLYSVQQATDFGVVGMPDAWQVQAGSSASVVVAVIDSGAETIHPDLASALDVGNSYNFVDNNTNIVDDIGHGTRVAGIIGASGNNGQGIAGVAFGCKILSLDVTDTTGVVTTARVISALDWAVSHGAQVANMSIRFTGASQLLENACDDAAAAGMLLVGAAGNDNQGSSPVYPASYDTVIGVGAIADDGVSRAPYSNYNGTDTTLVDLVAPGDTMFSTIPGSQYNGSYGSGTSFAAPVVSGVAALLKAKYPTQSAGAIRQHLLATAQLVSGSFTPANSAGSGKLSAKVALETVMTPALSVASVTIDDNTAVFAGNNNDGTFDKGETVRLVVTLNNAAADAASVTGSLASSDSQLLVNDGTGAWGNIKNSEIKSLTDTFTVSLNSGSPAHPIPFTLAVASNGGTYTVPLTLNVQGENSTTIVSSSYFSPQVWTANNTYEILNSQNFNVGSGLTVQPGTTVKLAPGVNININSGAFTANGTAAQPIVFTSTKQPSAFAPMGGVGPKNTSVSLAGYNQVRYVDVAAGSDVTGTGTAGNPWQTINFAQSQIGDAAVSKLYALLVAEGTYAPLQMQPFVDVFGGYLAGVWSRDIFANISILNAQGTQTAFTGTSDSKIDGFTLTGVTSSLGPPTVAAYLNGTVTNCAFVNNTGTFSSSGVAVFLNNVVSGNSIGLGGGGLIGFGASDTIRNNVIIRNSSSNAQLITSYGGTISNNVISDNRNASQIVDVFGPVTFSNNVLTDNQGSGSPGSAVACETGGVLTAFNNVISNVSSTMRGVLRNGGTLSISNSVIRGNGGGQISGTVSATYCDIQGGFAGTGNFDLDPLFTGTVCCGVASAVSVDNTRQVTVLTNSDASFPASGLAGAVIRVLSPNRLFYVLSASPTQITVSGNVGSTVKGPVGWTCTEYRVQKGSPCIDSGTNTGAPSTDIEGTSRPINGGVSATVDVGIHEFNPANPPYHPAGQLYIKSTAASASMSYCTVENTLGCLSDLPDTLIQNCTFNRNLSNGLKLSAGTTAVTSCSASANLLSGINAINHLLESCTATYNISTGLSGGNMTSATVQGNHGSGLICTAISDSISQGNRSVGMTTSGTVENCSSNDNLGAGITCLVGNITSCTALRNGGAGITISSGGTATACVAVQNTGNGLVTNGSTISNCISTSNTAAGVSGSGSSVLTDSTVLKNGGTAVSGVSSISNSKIAGNGSGVSGATLIASSYIAGNGGNGVTAGTITDSTVVGNSGIGASTPAAVSNSWVVANASYGVSAPTGNITFSTIRNNGSDGVRNIPVGGLLNNSNIFSNGTYDFYDNTNVSPGGLKDCRFNYWGTSSTAQMTGSPWPTPANVTRIYDAFENGLANGWYANWGTAGEFATSAVPNAPDSTPPAFLLDVTPNTANAVNVGFTTFTLIFSKAMNTSVDPAVTFGLASPYENHVVEPNPGWINSTTWQGSFWVQSDTGNGLNTLRVSNARAADTFVIPDDTSHKLVVDTTGGGTANNGLVVTVGSNSINLNWTENEKPPTTQGYSVHRSASGIEGTYLRQPGALVTTNVYSDSGLPSNTTFFYKVFIELAGGDSTQWTPPNYGITPINAAIDNWIWY
ncbi:MAG: S8 family serine peptidase [Candidatus Sumerlaeaceae bacterium]